jgi:nucleotide-binding universal stress UspA family protein
MIKDVVVCLPPIASDKGTISCAVSIAQTFEAHLFGVAFAYQPVVVGSIIDGFPAALIDGQRRENEKAAKDAIGRFEEAARLAGIAAESCLLNADVSGAAESFAQMARRFDLAVVRQEESGQPGAQDLIIEAALFRSGRPVLVVPYVHKGELAVRRAMVCWDGSETAARAIGDALPLLERANNVDVVMVSGEKPKSDELPGADLGQHLARHDLKVDVKTIPAAGIGVASAILSHAADNAIDLVVMGAYGHSRLREFVLGGATRGILQAMTVPTFMSH